jgi:membrane protease YdiL (CAAX protease family)
MKYNLRGQEPEQKKTEKVREKAEHKAVSFLRYFIPAIGPLMVYLFTEGLFVVLGSVIFHPDLSHEEFIKQKMNIVMIFGVITTFLILRRYSKKNGSTFFEDASLYLRDISPVKSLGCVLFGLGAALALSAFISLLPKAGPVAAYDTNIERLYESWSVYLGVLFNTFFTPLVEEVVFRGYMLNRLLPHWGERSSLLAVSIAFAFLHGTFIWVLYAFVMGWIIGKISIIEDNIFYAVLMHTGFNLLSAILWFLYLFRPETQEILSENKMLVFALGILGTALALFIAKVYKLERESMYVTRFFKR